MAALTVPESLGEIAPDWLTVAQGSAGASLTGYRAEVIALGDGFMNQLYRLRPVYDRADPNSPTPSWSISRRPHAHPVSPDCHCERSAAVSSGRRMPQLERDRRVAALIALTNGYA